LKLLILSLSALVLLPPVKSLDAVKAPIPFTSNGCSGFREAKFFSCCFVHDFAYWSGGTWSDRSRADRSLRQCIAATSHNKPVAYVAYALIRLTILGGEVFDFGWGRGWRNSERSLYAAITAGQQQRIDEERQRICRALTPDSRTGRYYVDETEPRDDIRQVHPAHARQLCGGDIPAANRLSTSLISR
jgi:hypothetical protein